MPELNPLSNEQIFLKKIAENTGSDYNTGDVSEINPLTIDQILLKEIAANTAGGGSGGITELKDTVAKNGAHNLCPNNVPNVTQYGITWKNEGPYFTIKGTNTSSIMDGQRVVYMTEFDEGEYVLSGTPVDISNKFWLNLYDNTSETTIVSQQNTTTGYNVVHLLAGHKYTVIGYVGANEVLGETEIPIYPMIRLASDTNPEFTPYAMTNRELTERGAIYQRIFTKRSGMENSKIIGTSPNQLYLIYGLSGVADNATYLSILFKQSNITNIGYMRHFGGNWGTAVFASDSYEISFSNIVNSTTLWVISANDFTVV